MLEALHSKYGISGPEAEAMDAYDLGHYVIYLEAAYAAEVARRDKAHEKLSQDEDRYMNEAMKLIGSWSDAGDLYRRLAEAEGNEERRRVGS
jgi:hypothetical protein